MRLYYNSNEIAKSKLKMNNVVAAYKSVITAINNNYVHQFASSMQIYLTKLGLVLNDCVEDVHIKAHTFLGSLDYICLKIIGNKQLYNVMRAIDINDNGNNMKHEIKDLKIDIDFTLKQYNELISQLVKKTGLDAFKVCYINRTKNVRDIPITEDQRHHKYFTINNFKMELKISPNYTIDKYEKVLLSKLTLYWPEGRSGFTADVVIINAKNNAHVGEIEQLDLSQGNSKHEFRLRCKEADLDRRVLELEVTITLRKKQQRTYTTGALFWKSYHSYDNFEEIEKRTEKISQFFKPN